MSFPIEIILFGFLLVITVTIIRLRSLFAAGMMTGAFSLLSAGLFTLMDAVDVAFTEAAVGAGVSTILFLSTLSITKKQERKSPNLHWPALAVCLVTGAVLVYGTLDMPAYGDPNAPIHAHVAPRYINESPKEIGLPNFVTSVLASYRGYDTFGELGVIFTAGVSVMLLLGGAPAGVAGATRREEPSFDDEERPDFDDEEWDGSESTPGDESAIAQGYSATDNGERASEFPAENDNAESQPSSAPSMSDEPPPPNTGEAQSNPIGFRTGAEPTGGERS